MRPSSQLDGRGLKLVSWARFRIHHYWSKSEEELERKAQQWRSLGSGRGMRGGGPPGERDETLAAYSGSEKRPRTHRETMRTRGAIAMVCGAAAALAMSAPAQAALTFGSTVTGGPEGVVLDYDCVFPAPPNGACAAGGARASTPATG